MNEKLRDKWARRRSRRDAMAIAREIQQNAWDFVPHVYLGPWIAARRHRARTSRACIGCRRSIPFWNVEKTMTHEAVPGAGPSHGPTRMIAYIVRRLASLDPW